MTPDDWERLIWRHTLSAIKWKVKLRSEQYLNDSLALYESCILAIGVAFGAKETTQPDISTAPKSAAELQRTLDEAFSGL